MNKIDPPFRLEKYKESIIEIVEMIRETKSAVWNILRKKE